MEVAVVVVIVDSISVTDVKVVAVVVTTGAVVVLVIVGALDVDVDVAAVLVVVTVKVLGVTRHEQADESLLGGYVPALSGAVMEFTRSSRPLFSGDSPGARVVVIVAPSVLLLINAIHVQWCM